SAARLTDTGEQGRICARVAPSARVGVLIEVVCATDFVAANREFIAFAKRLADGLLADPHYLEREDVERDRVALTKAFGEDISCRQAVRYDLRDPADPGGHRRPRRPKGHPPPTTGVREPRRPKPSSDATGERRRLP